MKKIVLMVLVVFTIFTISGCGNAGSNNEEHNEYTPPPGYLLPPFVISAGPSGDNENIDVVVSATFNEEMDAATINNETFKLEKLNNFDFSDRIPVTGTVAYLANTATFTPDIPLEYATGYIVTITNGAKNLNGISQDHDDWWDFATKAGP